MARIQTWAHRKSGHSTGPPVSHGESVPMLWCRAAKGLDNGKNTITEHSRDSGGKQV
jgi:hypothetical protein